MDNTRKQTMMTEKNSPQLADTENTDEKLVFSSHSPFCDLLNTCDSDQPNNIMITDIHWQHTLDEIYFKRKVVDTLSYLNDKFHPVDKTFNLSWSTKEQQSTIWSQQWSISRDFEYEVKLPGSACPLKITYDHMHNTSTAPLLVASEKSLPVTMAPRKIIIAHLVLLVSENMELPFVATIKVIGMNNTHSEHKVEGTWRGSLYKLSSSNVDVHETELGIM